MVMLVGNKCDLDRDVSQEVISQEEQNRHNVMREKRRQETLPEIRRVDIADIMEVGEWGWGGENSRTGIMR